MTTRRPKIDEPAHFTNANRADQTLKHLPKDSKKRGRPNNDKPPKELQKRGRKPPPTNDQLKEDQEAGRVYIVRGLFEGQRNSITLTYYHNSIKSKRDALRLIPLNGE